MQGADKIRLTREFGTYLLAQLQLAERQITEASEIGLSVRE